MFVGFIDMLKLLLLFRVGSFEDEEHRLVTSVAKAIDDCDVTFSLIEKSPFFDIERVAQAKRFLSIYSLKLTLLTFSDISTNVDKIVNNLTREADSLGNFFAQVFKSPKTLNVTENRFFEKMTLRHGQL
jgi:hypothetical protein